ncbi:MAG: hypothetical protein GTO02_08095 [Candidatus Dadabacteria bacterium]|nr:hypothetical protein [Candidatus Dadabacteria bacterium]
MINKGYKIRALDINELFWMDVDYPADLFKARSESDKFLNKDFSPRFLRVVDSN